MTSPKKLTLDGYTQVFTGKVKRGDLVQYRNGDIRLVDNAFGTNISSHPICDFWRKISKPKIKTKLPPPIPSGLATPPNDYVFLGRVKDITVPDTWGTNDGHKDGMDFAWFYSSNNEWLEANHGWVRKYLDAEIFIAAKVDSPLYKMQNYTKADPTWEITQLKAKLQSAEEALSVRASELTASKDSERFYIEKTREYSKDIENLSHLAAKRAAEIFNANKELAEIRRHLANVEKARDSYKQLYAQAEDKLGVARRKFADFQNMF